MPGEPGKTVENEARQGHFPVMRRGLIAALLPMLLICGEAAAEQLRIGLSLPLSGSTAVLGRQFQQGAEFALKELAEESEIEIVVADDGCDADLAGLAAADLVAAGVDLATGMICNDAARAAALAFAGSDVPVVTAGARSEQLMRDAEREGWKLFRIAPGDDGVAAAAAQILSQRWRGTPWAVIDDGTVYGRTLADNLRQLMEEAGQPPQFADNYRPAQSTQAGLIRRLQRSGVSAAFVAGSAEDIAVIWKNAAEFAFRMEVAGGETLESLPLVEGPDAVPDGLLAVMEPDPLDVPGVSALSARLVAAGVEPEPYVFQGYAAMELALAALRPAREETVRALGQTVFWTVLGTVDFDETGRNTVSRYTLFQWRGGRFVPISESR